MASLKEEEVPVNNIAGGAIPGAGIGPQGDTIVRKKPGLLRRYKGFKEFTNGKLSNGS